MPIATLPAILNAQQSDGLRGWVTIYAIVYSQCQLCCELLFHRLVVQTTSATETSTSNANIIAFWTGVVLTTTALNTTAGNRLALTIGFRVGCSAINSAIYGLTL